jgi:hypothetical protein
MTTIKFTKLAIAVVLASIKDHHEVLLGQSTPAKANSTAVRAANTHTTTN